MMVVPQWINDWGDRGLCFLMENSRGDPISGLYFGSGIVVIGTMLGRVVGFSFAITNEESPDVREIGERSDIHSTGDGANPVGCSVAIDDGNNHEFGSHCDHTRGGPDTLGKEVTAAECVAAKKSTEMEISTHCQCVNMEDSAIGRPLPSKKSRHSRCRMAGLCGRITTEDVKSYEGLQQGPPGHFELYAAYSDNGVKALYATRRIVYGIVGSQHCRVWNRSRPSQQEGFRLDQKIASTNVLFTLSSYNSPTALLVTNNGTILVNQQTETQVLCPFKVCDADLIPVDFDADKLRLMIIQHKTDRRPLIRVFALPMERDISHNVLQPVFQQEISSSKGICVVKFWSSDRVAVVTNRTVIEIFSIDHSDANSPEMKLLGHKDAIVALHGSTKDVLISLSRNSQLIIWNQSGHKLHSFSVTPAAFRLGFTYHLAKDADGHMIVFTSDAGLFLFDPNLAYGRGRFE